MKSATIILLLVGIAGCEKTAESNHSHGAGNHDAREKKEMDRSKLESTTDKQLPVLKELEKLGVQFEYDESFSSLALSGGNDAAVKQIARLNDLKIVSIAGPQITNSALLSLSTLSNLKHLEVYAPQVTDAGLAHLKSLTNLNFLALDTCPEISDAGLVHLIGFKKLETLSVIDTKVTPAGVAELNKAIPNCQINR